MREKVTYLIFLLTAVSFLSYFKRAVIHSINVIYLLLKISMHIDLLNLLFLWIANKNDTTENSCYWFENRNNSSPIWKSQTYIQPKLMCTHGKKTSTLIESNFSKDGHLVCYCFHTACSSWRLSFSNLNKVRVITS